MINPKTSLRWALLVIVFGSIGFYALQRSQEQGTEEAAASAPEDLSAATVVVTYFTTDVRCESCLTIERLSRQAIEEGFPAEVASGEVVFRVLNTDRPQNQQFIDAYELTNKTVIVSHRQNGEEAEWTDRQDVWLLFDEPEEFLAYVRGPVRLYLGQG